MPITRRTFLKSTAAAIAAPYIYTPAWAKEPPSNRIAMGFIGVGGQGGSHLKACVGSPECTVVAIADVDLTHREAAKKVVETAYEKQIASGNYKGVGLYNDYREMLARSDIDAVLIATPDHWHALTTIDAAKAGKDVYCEKPLSLTVAEGQEMVRTVRQFGRVLQTGCHERSGRNARYACELVRSGRIGQLRRVEVGLPPHEYKDVGPQPAMPVPPELDYNFWLGTAPWAPYTKFRCHYTFRFISDYSGGEITNRGAHAGDIALWGAAPFLKGPAEIEGRGEFFNSGLFDTARTYYVEFRYANGVTLVLDSNKPRHARFEGDEGWISVEIHGGALTASDPRLLNLPVRPGDVHLHASPGHREDFWQAMRTRGDVVAPVEDGHQSAVWCHLCNIALLLGRKLRWDPDGERFIDDPEANRLLSRPARAPWRM